MREDIKEIIINKLINTIRSIDPVNRPDLFYFEKSKLNLDSVNSELRIPLDVEGKIILDLQEAIEIRVNTVNRKHGLIECGMYLDSHLYFTREDPFIFAIEHLLNNLKEELLSEYVKKRVLDNLTRRRV